MALFSPSDRTSIVGHRGSGRGSIPHNGFHYRENTIESSLHAVASGAHWVEIDVVRTRENELVLSHDLTIILEDRSRHPIGGLRNSELKQLGIDTLVELFAALPPTIGVVVEVKASKGELGSDSTAALAAQAVRDELLRRQARPLLIYGFEPSTAMIIRSHPDAESIPLGVIGRPWVPLETTVARGLECGALAIAVHTSSLLGPTARVSSRRPIRERISEIHALGLEVMAWTASTAQLGRLAAAGIDAVCVDDVAAARQELSAHDI